MSIVQFCCKNSVIDILFVVRCIHHCCPLPFLTINCCISDWAANCDETEPDRYRHASYNTLVLFSVTTQSSHFVTTVSPDAQGKRLSFNGWWSSSWRPSVEDDLEERLATRGQRIRLSDQEFQDIRAILADYGNGISTKRRRELRRLFDLAQHDQFPPGQGGYY